MATYVKKHIKIFQNSIVIFDEDCYVRVDKNNNYFYMTDRTKRRLIVCENPDVSHESYITLGVADTAIIKDK